MISLEIITPDKIVYKSDKVIELTLSTDVAMITIAKDHEPLVSLTIPGEIVISELSNTSQSSTTSLAVSTGVIEVDGNNNVQVIATTAEKEEEIDVERASEAMAKARQYLREATENQADIEFARIQSIIEKEAARIKVGKKYKKLDKSRDYGDQNSSFI